MGLKLDGRALICFGMACVFALYGGTAYAKKAPAKRSFAYVTNTAGNSISEFSYDSATGKLTPLASIEAGQGPWAVASDRNGKFAYAVTIGTNELITYPIDPKNGHLLAPISRIPTGKNPAYISWDPSGKFLTIPEF